MNTKSLILKKGLFKKITDYPLWIQLVLTTNQIQQGKTINNFLKKIISKQQIHKG